MEYKGRDSRVYWEERGRVDAVRGCGSFDAAGHITFPLKVGHTEALGVSREETTKAHHHDSTDDPQPPPMDIVLLRGARTCLF